MNYKSESANSYQEPQRLNNAADEDKRRFYKGNIVLGDRMPNEMYNTSYNLDYKEKPIFKNEEARNDRADRGSSIVYGSDLENWESEAKAQ